MISRLKYLVLIGVIAASCSTTTAQSYKQYTVVVTGVGSDLLSAKSDAIRAAMALRTNQTIIAERLLVNEKMVTDMLASSMSGELSYFKILDQTRDANGFIVIQAEIGISKRELRQKKTVHTTYTGNRFNALVISNEISSALELKEAKRLHKKARLENAKKLTSKLFFNFPDRAREANLDMIQIDPENPDEVVLKLTYNLKKDWDQKLEQRIKLVEGLWSNKKGFWATNTYDEHIIKICKESFWGGGCTHLPTRPKFKNSTIQIYIPVFSFSGNYLTCLKTQEIEALITVNTNNYNSTVYRNGITIYRYSSKQQNYDVRVDSKKLYSSSGNAEFFYPFIVSGNPESTNSKCELEGMKMHAASGNAMRTISRSLISKATVSKKLQKGFQDDAYLHKSLNKKRKKYTTSPGSKIKYK